MKKLSVLAAVLCAMAISLPMSADAGFNVGGILKEK